MPLVLFVTRRPPEQEECSLLTLRVPERALRAAISALDHQHYERILPKRLLLMPPKKLLVIVVLCLLLVEDDEEEEHLQHKHQHQHHQEQDSFFLAVIV